MFTVVLFVLMASIDNTVFVLVPGLTLPIITDLRISNQLIGLVVGVNLVVVALSGLFWGYRSDQGDRRRWIGVGTLLWVVPIGLIGFAQSISMFFLLFTIAGIGLGCISTVGYSIITDLVPQRWRGLMLGVWGLAQGIGALGGNILIAQVLSLGYTWQVPFVVVASIGSVCCALVVFTISPPKGAGDDVLQPLHQGSEEYAYQIRSADIAMLMAKPSNRWLMAQGLLAQLTFGSLSWIVTLIAARIATQGITLNLATSIAALLTVLFQLGGIVSLFWGWVGDRLQRRTPQARALLAAYGFWAAIPCYVVVFWVPLPITGQRDQDVFITLLTQLRHSSWWWAAILAATLAVIAQATNAPNWYALVAEVNLPEHRGTAFSLITLANNLGRAIGAVLVGSTFDVLERSIAAPLNYAIGLTLFQVFFVPAGICFWLAARTTPRDAATVQHILQARVAQVTRSFHSE